MDTWVYQRGFPQIEVSVGWSEAFGSAQRRFLAIPDETDTTIWKVPVQLRGVAGGEPFDHKVLLCEDDETVVELPGPTSSSSWPTPAVMASIAPDTRSRCSPGCSPILHRLDDIERYGLVSDTWAMIRAAQVPASDFLDLVGAFGDEKEQAIWSVITGGLAAIEHHALSDEARPAFQTFRARPGRPHPRPARVGAGRRRQRPHPEAPRRPDRRHGQRRPRRRRRSSGRDGGRLRPARW